MQTKNVVITGGSKGLGLAIVQSLLAHDYKVISLSRGQSDALNKLKKMFPDRLETINTDITELEELPELCKRVIDDKMIYGLINNAGYVNDALVLTSTSKEIQKMIKINLTAPILLSRLFSKHFILNNEGRIINISSIASNKTYKGLVTYGATKAGLIAFSKGLAMELGKKNITVNIVSPGFIPTAMNEHLSPDSFAAVVGRIPLRRFPVPEDIADSVLFLLSEKAKNITGMNMVVDGGQSL